MRLDQVLELIPLSRAAIYRRVRDGSFPRPLALGPRVRAWRFSEVRQWIAERPSIGGAALPIEQGGTR